MRYRYSFYDMINGEYIFSFLIVCVDIKDKLRVDCVCFLLLCHTAIYYFHK